MDSGPRESLGGEGMAEKQGVTDSSSRPAQRVLLTGDLPAFLSHDSL